MISRSSEYAIRALTFLAQQADGRHHLARDMAERLGIPAPFLGKVLQPLVGRGVLRSQRGRSGGFRLARPADEIRLIEVVESQERLSPAPACVLGQATCDAEHACPMHELWFDIASSFRAKLERTTLRDLAEFADANPGCAYPLQAKPPTPRAWARGTGGVLPVFG